jgi:hypothetical protein
MTALDEEVKVFIAGLEESRGVHSAGHRDDLQDGGVGDKHEYAAEPGLEGHVPEQFLDSVEERLFV